MSCYCHDKTSAEINITYPIKLQIIVDNLPVCVDITSEEFEVFTHEMTSPINKSFKTEIESVINIGGSWNPGGPKAGNISCPTTASIPVYGVYPTTDGKASPIEINGSSVIGNFDWQYADNSGSCIYKVVYKNPLYNLAVTANSLEIYKNQFKEKPQYSVGCDNDCPKGQIKCVHPGYPGYCCIPCQSTANKLNNLANKIK